MSKFKFKKVDVSLLTVAIPIFTGVSASAEGTKPNVKVGLSNSSDLVAPIQEDNVVFHGENVKSQPDELAIDEMVEFGGDNLGKQERKEKEKEKEKEKQTTEGTEEEKKERKKSNEVLLRGVSDLRESKSNADKLGGVNINDLTARVSRFAVSNGQRQSTVESAKQGINQSKNIIKNDESRRLGILPDHAKQSTGKMPMLQTNINQQPNISTTQSLQIITPVGGETTAKTTNLAIQYHPSLDISVTINENAIDADIPSYIQKDEAGKIYTKIWYNVPLKNGENIIAAKASNGESSIVKVTLEEQKYKLIVTPVGEARIPADGRSIITINGKITNEKGEVIREDATVTLSATAGKFVGADQDSDAPGFQVLARNGEFSANLQSALEPQNVKVRAAVETRYIASLPPIETYTNIEFITNLRPSLATGVVNLRIGAGGTNYWGSNKDFLNPSKIGRTDVDLNASAFATGKVGDWLFTGAFNSKRPLNQDCNGEVRLFGGVQNCEKAYPVYGDASSVTQTAPSTDSIYAKFERTPNIPGAESDYFMWGDYNTAEFARTSQLFTATTRQLHGFKGNYNLGNLQITGLFANNIKGFQRDTISPNGTSGYYFLSRRLVIPGSENIYLESEEINRPGTVVKRKALVRGADYEIDYDRGTLLFRSRILSTQLNPFGSTLVNRIVATYENDSKNDSKLYAARAQYNFREGVGSRESGVGDRKLEIGRESGVGNEENKNSSSSPTPYSPLPTPYLATSYLSEDQNAQNFQLYGADFFVPLGNFGQILGEYAHSNHNSLAFGNVSGYAYRLEASGNITPSVQGQAYYRSVTENFANNATFSFAPGQTRYGGNLLSKITDTTSFNVNYDKETNFGIAPAQRTQTFDIFNPQPQPTPGSKVDNSLTTLRAGVQQKLGDGDISLEYVKRDRTDHINNQFSGNASQLVSKLNFPLTESLAFRAQNETNLGSSDALYPNRTTLGLDWALYPGFNVQLAHQFFDGGLLRGNSITSLDTTYEHKFTEDTSVNGRYSIFAGIDGMNDQGAFGLNHRIRLAPGLKLNLGYERIQSNLFGSTAAGIRFAQPYATGQSASSLGLFSGNSYSIGLDYTDNPEFQANARFEYRDGKEANNMVISAAAAGKLSPALTAAVRYQQAGGANQLLDALPDTANLRVGLAYRDPSNDKFNSLLAYEYRQNPSTTPDTILTGTGNGSTEHLFSAEAIYAPDWRWEFYGKYAFRNATSYLANNFTNTSAIHLGQLRASYQLGYRTDLAVEGRWLGQPTEGFNEFGIALEGGYHITPDLRVGLGYAFGSADDRDFTGYRSAGGPYLNVTYKINELFGGFGRQKVAPPQQQESAVKANI
jgi:hypothetical protein